MTTTLTVYPRTWVLSSRNLITNPKAGTNLTGLVLSLSGGGAATGGLTRSTSGGPTISGSSTATYAGVTMTTAATGVQTQIYAGAAAAGSFAVTAGSAYNASAYVNISLASTGALISIQFYDATSTLLTSTPVRTTGSTAANAWSRVSVQDTAPTGAVTASVFVRAGVIMTVGSVLRVSAIMLEHTTSVNPYYDGDTTDTTSFQYSWLGTANASASNKYIPNPTDVFTPQLMLGYTAARVSQNLITPIPGGQYPFVAVNAPQGRTGTISFLILDEPDVIALEALLQAGTQFQLADTDHTLLTMQFVLGTGNIQTTLNTETLSTWQMDIPFAEQLHA